MCAIQSVNRQTKYLNAFERGMEVGARHTGVCHELQHCYTAGFNPRSTVSRVYQEWSSTQIISSQLDTTVGSIGVNMGQHPSGMVSTPCRALLRRIEAVLRAKGGATQY